MSVSFARMAARYREEARALESMRHVIGWNYCGFFVVKEGLAFTYLKASSRRMILMALAIYRELAEHYQSLPDATRIEYFYTPLPAAASSTATTATTSTAGSSPPSESSLPSGGGGGGGGGGEFTDEASIAELQDDCCVPLSLWCNNSFRMMIYRNSISEFHFQRYLFCRQFNVRFIEALVQKETKRDALTHHLSLCVCGVNQVLVVARGTGRSSTTGVPFHPSHGSSDHGASGSMSTHVSRRMDLPCVHLRCRSRAREGVNDCRRCYRTIVFGLG